jgi:hypothetical protein
LTPGESNQDFVLNSHPVMMGGHQEIPGAPQAVEGGRREGALFVSHPHAAVALASRHHAKAT